jgi:heme ABC exporter ATP-binding subunit CcmA
MPWSGVARSNCCAIWSRAEPSRVSTPHASSPNGGAGEGARGGPPPGLSIQFSEVEKRYGMRLALRGISLEIAASECVALVGHNGSGKTTLLKIAAQLTRPSRGKITFDSGENPISLEEVKSRIGMVGHHTLLYEELSAEENLIFFAKLFGLENSTEKARQALQPVGLSGRATDLVRTFSRGMRQRLSIARALLASPGLLLLDEAGTGLDPEGQHWLAATIQRLRDSGCTILMSTHGRNETQGAVTRAIRLDGGKITHDSGAGGNPNEILVMAAVRDGGEESAP